MSHNRSEEITEERAEKILESLDKAFEWLVVLLTVLIAIIFQFLTWGIDPKQGTAFITRIMVTLVIPLTVSIMGWLWQAITLNRERKIFLKLFSWSSLSIVFLYYLELFAVLVMLGAIPEFPQNRDILIAIVLLFVAFFPHSQILKTYRAATLNLHFWEKGRFHIWTPHLAGVVIVGLSLLIPYYF